jgi:hypothetical protein
MKRKRPEIVERRRTQVEPNLVAEPKGRLAARRRGCLPFLTLALPVAGALLAIGLGLR